MNSFCHAKFCGLFCSLLLAVFSTQAQSSYTNNTPLSVPDWDGTGSGVQSSLTTSGLTGTITGITLTLDLIGTGYGAFNGDYFVSLLNNQGGYAVLLNRVGVSSTDDDGYPDNGFHLTFSDLSANDIHFYQTYVYNLDDNGALTGLWQPDGRDVFSLADGSVFDSAARTAMLSSFFGQTPNDTWTLYLNDAGGPGGTGELIDWSLTITTSTSVPEPASVSLLMVGLIFCAFQLRKKHAWRAQK